MARWCMKCKEDIPLNTSGIYLKEAVNPVPPPTYFELCLKCAGIESKGVGLIETKKWVDKKEV